jgi:hypothetical protein
MIKGQKLVVLRNEDSLPNRFPVDILILAFATKKVDVNRLQKIFSPKKIVIANNQLPYLIKEWESQCVKHKITLHNTPKDGAFILP